MNNGENELTKEGDGYKLELGTDQKDSITLTPSAAGVRLAENASVKITAKVADTNETGLAVKANADGTVTISVEEGATIEKEKSVDVTFSIEKSADDATGLIVVPDEVTKTVTISTKEATE